jgi:hypothetical protein
VLVVRNWYSMCGCHHLHPHSEDIPLCGGKGPLNMGFYFIQRSHMFYEVMSIYLQTVVYGHHMGTSEDSTKYKIFCLWHSEM